MLTEVVRGMGFPRDEHLRPRFLLDWHRVRQDVLTWPKPRYAAHNLAHDAACLNTQCQCLLQPAQATLEE
jgi:hypothetical protein